MLLKNILKFLFNFTTFYIVLRLLKTVYFFFPKTKNNRILLISLHHIGDVLFTTSAMHAVKSKLPDHKIDVWLKKASIPILQFNEDINKMYIDHGRHTRINSIKTLFYRIRKNPMNLIEMWKNDYDIIFDFSACFESALFTAILGRKKKYGIYVTSFFKSAYNNSIYAKHTIQHMKYFYCDVVGLAGFSHNQKECPMIINISNDIVDKVKREIINNNPKNIITIAPFAGWQTKEWEIERFILLAEKLSKLNYRIFFLGAPNERSRVDKFLERFSDTIINLIGQADILESSVLIKMSTLFIGCDSCQTHIADALKVNCIALFSSTNPLYHTVPNNKNQLVIYKNLKCSAHRSQIYCAENQYFFTCPNDHQCMKSISVEEVFNACMQLLEN